MNDQDIVDVLRFGVAPALRIIWKHMPEDSRRAAIEELETQLSGADARR